MKIIKYIKNFFLNFLFKMKYYFSNLLFKIKSFFYFRYIGIYEIITLKLLASATSMVRNLLIIKGKDPNYVPPPPIPVVKEEKVKPRPNFYIPYVPSWVKSSFSDSSEHIIYKNRMNLNLRPNPDPYDLVRSKLPEPVKETEVVLNLTVDDQPSGDELLSLLDPNLKD